jgi:hemerythrin-like domain-containing protein
VLGDCHRRIERFLRVLIVVTEQAHGGELNAELREALEIALRYFREAAPKNTADEEDSLFPQLRVCGHPEATQVLTVLEGLEHDHDAATQGHAEIERLGRRWLHDGRLSPNDTEQLASQLRTLEAIYTRHIAVEDGDLFPLARRVLTPAALAALGRAMALRHGLDPDAPPPAL